MKKGKKRLVSLLLVLALLFGVAPVFGSDAGEIPVLQGGQAVSHITLPENEKTALTVSCGEGEAYQWQIKIPGTDGWADIYDKTGASCSVTCSLLGTMQDSSKTAYLRCRVTAQGESLYSTAVAVTMTAGTAPVPAETAETGGYVVESEHIGEPSGNGAAYALSSDRTSDTCTVTIRYLYHNQGPETAGSVANDYVATLAKGTDFAVTVSSPVRTGYKAYWAPNGTGDWNEAMGHWFTRAADGSYREDDLTDGQSFSLSVSDIQEDVTYYIIYLPQMTTVRITAYLQNIYDDFYSFGGDQTIAARVGSSVLRLPAVNRQGFTTLQYDDAAVAADGSTVLQIYYDRQYRLMNFQLSGGYGQAPVYARYQTEFGAAVPTRAGYEFAGWEADGDFSDAQVIGESSAYEGGIYNGQTYRQVAQSLAQRLKNGERVEVPPFDITFRAIWIPKTAAYRVVYWKENANDGGYSYWGTVTRTGIAEQTVTFDPDDPDFNTANLDFARQVVQAEVPAKDGFSQIPERREYEFFTYDGEKSAGTVTAVVQGDNSTVLNVYYSRNRYNLKYYFARTESYVTAQTVSDGVRYRSGKAFQVATATTTASVTGAEWSHSGQREFTLPQWVTERYTVGTEEIDGWRYCYLVLPNIKYEQTIASVWPAGAVPAIGPYATPEWAPIDGCKFRTDNGVNATLKLYTTASSEIIHDPGDPDASKFVAWWTQNTLAEQYFHIYYSPIPGAGEETTMYRGEPFVEQPTISYVMAYNGWTQIVPIRLYGVTLKYSEITAVRPDSATEATQNSWFYYERNPHTLSFYNLDQCIRVVGTDGSLVYGQKIAGLNTFTAEDMEKDHYPQGFEPGAYRFRGWSLSPDSYIPVDWDGYTMDDGDLAVYAYWEKSVYTVTFYQTYGDLQSGRALVLDGYTNPQQVFHGDTAQLAESLNREGYRFNGWFYLDEATGQPAAFLPDHMMVKQDLQIYADWQSETMISYTIHYVLIGATRSETGEYAFADGHRYDLDFTRQTQIADDTAGQLQDGRTKTFYPKALPELWEDYRQNHYPMLSSHAVMFSAEQNISDPALKIENIVRDDQGNVTSYEVDYTFYYVKIEEISYTVRYLNRATNTNVFRDFAQDSSGSLTMEVPFREESTRNAVTTERMKLILGYVPDAYQKRLILTAFPRPGTEDNVITFYYTEDASPMYYVEHLVENPGGTWTQMDQTFGTGTAGDTITCTANTYPGHEFAPEQVWVNTAGEGILPAAGENWVGTVAGGAFVGTYTDTDGDGTGDTASGTLGQEEILVIRFYYVRSSYDYRVYHRIYGTDRLLFDTELFRGARYGDTVTYDAAEKNQQANARGYRIDGDLVKTLQITAQDSQNQMTFWYSEAPVEINYRVVVEGTVGIAVNGCYVTPSMDSTTSHSADAHGSEAFAGSGYWFAGWYRDGACTVPAAEDWVEGRKLTPQPEGEGEDAYLHEATYYARFLPICLTVTKAGQDVRENDSFLFRVQGISEATAGFDMVLSVTGTGSTQLRYLPAGDYLVTELAGWCWRYDCQEPVTVTVTGETEVVFTNTAKDVHWLGGESSASNQFAVR